MVATLHPRDEVEDAFRHYFMTGPVLEDWIVWSKLFTEDARYSDHYWGIFHGPAEIQRFLEGTMSYASFVYSPLVWYNIDGSHVVYKVINRADNPEPGEPPFECPSLQVIQYAGDGKWASEDDWWTTREMRLLGTGYAAAKASFPDADPMSRADWGNSVDWARPPEGHVATPSWLGRDVPGIARLADITFGDRHPR
jgi:hypothetical protein